MLENGELCVIKLLMDIDLGVQPRNALFDGLAVVADEGEEWRNWEVHLIHHYFMQ
jgi:hypothetical protein